MKKYIYEYHATWCYCSWSEWTYFYTDAIPLFEISLISFVYDCINVPRPYAFSHIEFLFLPPCWKWGGGGCFNFSEHPQLSLSLMESLLLSGYSKLLFRYFVYLVEFTLLWWRFSRSIFSVCKMEIYFGEEKYYYVRVCVMERERNLRKNLHCLDYMCSTQRF